MQTIEEGWMTRWWSLVALPASALVLVAGSVFALVDLAVASPQAAGDQLWVAEYDGPGTGADVAYAVATSPDGSRVFVTGSSAGISSSSDYATVAYDAFTGSMLWEQRYNGTGNGFDDARDITVSPDGSTVFVTGTAWGPVDEYATLAYDAATGSRRWLEIYSDRSADARALAISPDGSRVFVTGSSDSAGTDTDYLTVAYDAATGYPLWVRRKNGYHFAGDIATAVRVSPDGSAVYVTGESSGKSIDYLTLAYAAATGSTLWTTRTDMNGRGDSAWSIATSPAGSKVFVAGHSESIHTDSTNGVTVAYDAASGKELWRRSLSKQPGSWGAYANAVASSSDGSKVFVTGTSGTGLRTSECATVAYDPSTGGALWRRVYDAGADIGCGSLGVSADGSKVFVAGVADGDYAALAYDATTGASLWEARYDGGREDTPYALAVSPDGSAIYETGESSGSDSGHYTTVAFEA